MTNRSTSIRLTATALALGGAASVGVAPPAQAAPVAYPVDVVVHTDFTGGPSYFEGNVPGCASGVVAEGPAHVTGTPWGGNYVGLKEFTCDGGEAGFTVRLAARFGEYGSVGTWTLVDAWGFLEGARASGSLVGTPTAIGIDDRYIGQAR